MGLVASMEKQNSEDDQFDPSSITAVKASLMGPISGIGDSFFWGILRVIAAGIGISLAATGSPLGAILFLVIYNVPAFLIHYYALYSGYSVGASFIQRMYESGGMKILTKASSMLGLMMMGSMTASNVKFKTILEVSVEGSKEAMKIQDYLDQLFVGIVPLTVTLIAFGSYGKKSERQRCDVWDYVSWYYFGTVRNMLDKQAVFFDIDDTLLDNYCAFKGDDPGILSWISE